MALPETRTGARTEIGRTVSGYATGTFAYGLALVVLGVFAWIFAGIASVATILMLGLLLAVGGIVEMALALRHRAEEPMGVPLASGLLSLAIGVLMVVRPGIGVAAAGFLLAAFFVATGLLRVAFAISLRPHHWGWDLAYGLLALLLGVSLAAQWPVSSFWVVGALVGIELILRGGAIMGVALALRNGLRHARART